MATLQSLIGTWKLVSWTRKVLDTGEEADAFGVNPRGFLNYASDGRVMVLIVTGDRKAPQVAPPTNQEKISLYDSMWAYTGTFAFENGKVTHNLDITSNQSWTGIQQTRFCKLEGRRLTLTTPVLKDPTDGQDSIHAIAWDKVS